MTRNEAYTARSTGLAAWHIRTGFLTLMVVALAFAAFDDITTDNATRFPLEYAMLLISSVWCLILAMRLAKIGHRILAAVSLFAVAGSVWGGRAIGARTPGIQLEYVLTLAGVIWFFVLSMILLSLGIWSRHVADRRA